MADDQSKKTTANPLVSLYWREVERYNRATADWQKEGGDIENVYLDSSRSKQSARRMYSMLWANVETLKPAIYAKLPVVQCSRRHKDRDPIARVCAELMERATNTTFDVDGSNEVFKAARDDRLIPGRGQVWVRYEANIETYEEPDGTTDGETGEEVMVSRERKAGEKVCIDYVRWTDFGHNMCGTWKDVWLVWRVVYKTQEEMKERFGAEVAAQVSYNAKMPSFGSGSDKDEADSHCKVIEIWDKRRGTVSWMVEGQHSFLDTGPPPTNFHRFFPCPQPWFATRTSKELIPVPDYRYYKDQAKEINDLTDKIGNMQQWLIVKAFVPGTSNEADPIEEAIRDTGNETLVQEVASMKEWTSRGGAKGLLDWLPIDAVAKALQVCIQMRDQLIQDVFQITGISDILRGQGDANETATAQQIKAQTGTRRLRDTKEDGERFCMEVGQLVAEIIAEQFDPETIADMTGYKYVPMPQPQPNQLMLAGPGMGQPQMGGNVVPMPGMDPRRMMGANGGPQMESEPDESERELTFDDRHMQLLRDDRMRTFRIDVETDSTVAADEAAEKQSRMELVGVVGKYLGDMSKMPPDLFPIAGQLLMFAVRGFRAGRSLEESLERSFKQIETQHKQRASQPPPPDPRVVKAQADVQIDRQRLQHEVQHDQAQMALDARKQQTDAQLEIRQQNIDANLRMRDSQLDAHAKARDHAERILRGGSST